MATTGHVLVIHIFLGFFVFSSASFLRARFPRPHPVTVRHTRKSACSFCAYDTNYLTQELDHFGYANNKTFQQRYLVNAKTWKDGKPIFFYCGNEGDITWFANNTGFMWDIAPEYNAMLVFAEHRYYGKSMPFGNQSYKDPEHLGFLSSEQALADFAVLIRYIKKTVKGAENSPVVAFGGSYGGMLASWFRMKYPSSVVGAIAASAPIWQFENLTPCERFYQIVTEDFRKHGGEVCPNLIRKIWKLIESKGETAAGRKDLTSIFRLCQPLKDEEDAEQLSTWIQETWAMLAMVEYPYPADFLEPLPAWPIKVACSHLQNESLAGDALLSAVRQAVGTYYNYTGNEPCFNTSQQATENLGDQGWQFQACSEMVMPLCTDGVKDMYPESKWNLKEYIESCEEKWKVTPRPNWVEVVYGGKNIKAHSNIVFSNGDLDPWAGSGVLKSLSPTLVAVIIENGAHHLDLRHSNPLDPQSVIDARNLEKKHISQWIEEWNKKHQSKRKHKKFRHRQVY